MQIESSVLGRISNRIVELHGEYYGKGPEKVKSFAFDEGVFCVIHNGLTTVEETLAEEGAGDEVTRLRRMFQEVMRDRFAGAVEEEVGRPVTAYLSQMHVGPNIGIEVFFLDGADGRSA